MGKATTKENEGHSVLYPGASVHGKAILMAAGTAKNKALLAQRDFFILFPFPDVRFFAQ
jgi:hypothetical protein